MWCVTTGGKKTLLASLLTLSLDNQIEKSRAQIKASHGHGAGPMDHPVQPTPAQTVNLASMQSALARLHEITDAGDGR